MLDLIFLCLMVFALAVGCAKPPGPAAPTKEVGNQSNSSADATGNPDSVASPAGAERGRPDAPIQSELIARYARLSEYSDTTTLRLTYRFEDGRQESESTVLETSLAKPNRLRVALSNADNRVEVVSDGQNMQARIIDPVTNNFDGQMVLTDAPEKLTVSDLYKITELLDPVAPDEMLSALLGAPTGLDMCPLGILLNEGGLVELLKSYPLRRLGEETIRRDPATLNAATQRAKESPTECVVESLVSTDGEYRFWIEKRTGLLQRIVFPPSLTNLPPGIKQVELVADISDVRTANDPQGFRLPDTGKSETNNQSQVRHFVLPPLPPATELWGKRLSGLKFTTSDQKEVELNNRNDQITVVTWFHDHPASRLVIDQLEALRSRADDQVRFVHVLVDQRNGSKPLFNLSDWSFAQPPVLDTNAVGLRELGVKQAPTTAIIGTDNTLQYFEVGANPAIGSNVVAVIERLKTGQNVAGETVNRYQAMKEAYQRQLALAKAGDGWIEQIESELPSPTEPAQLKLTEAWKTDQVAEPGNLLIVPGRIKRLVVVDGWNQLVTLDADGKIQKRTMLELPADAGITMLRAGKDKRDRGLIAAATRGGRRAFLLDFGGKLLMQYPRVVDPAAALGDLAFGDLDGDNQPELLVAWQGNRGTHCVAIDGKQRWINRVASGVVSATVVPTTQGRSSVLVAGEKGRPYLIDQDGRTEQEVSIGLLAVHQFTAWPGSARGYESLLAPADAMLGDTFANYCGIATTGGGNITAIGVNKKWNGLWEYPLPSGVYRHQVDWPQSIDIPKIGPTWLLPGADGSIHFVAADGKFTDSFRTGRHIRGLAALRANGEPLLVVATDQRIQAYRVASAE